MSGEDSVEVRWLDTESIVHVRWDCDRVGADVTSPLTSAQNAFTPWCVPVTRALRILWAGTGGSTPGLVDRPAECCHAVRPLRLTLAA